MNENQQFSQLTARCSTLPHKSKLVIKRITNRRYRPLFLLPPNRVRSECILATTWALLLPTTRPILPREESPLTASTPSNPPSPLTLGSSSSFNANASSCDSARSLYPLLMLSRTVCRRNYLNTSLVGIGTRMTSRSCGAIFACCI